MKQIKILFVEPPKDLWFVMGQYLPPPLGILQLAAYLEQFNKNVEIEVLDCQAKDVDWRGLEKYIESTNPDIVAPSGLATCNAYTTIRAVEIAKKVNPKILTIVGGSHFTTTAYESLEAYPEIDVIIRGEGEQTLLELVTAYGEEKPLATITGVSFKHDGKVYDTPQRPLLDNLDELPYPGYHFVEDVVHKYHFKMMADSSKRYALIEGSRGCPYNCTFCSQCVYWQRTWRGKSPKRIADEMQFLYDNYGMKFLWLTDDNFGLKKHTRELCDELISRGLANDIMWFMQARCDEIATHQALLPALREAGNRWILLGVESSNESTLDAFNKKIMPSDSQKAIKLLKAHDIFTQAMVIIGERKDSAESIAHLRASVNEMDPDLAIYTILTPFPGTKIYEEAKRNGWIEDTNWAHYDMTHAIMPTEHLSLMQVQEELYNCYRSFYGSLPRRLRGVFSPNALKKRAYRHLAGQGVLQELKNLFWRATYA
jgi:anaerobic magnesium-protoporphyrin IX monomethyl ester cyclase